MNQTKTARAALAVSLGVMIAVATFALSLHRALVAANIEGLPGISVHALHLVEGGIPLASIDRRLLAEIRAAQPHNRFALAGRGYQTLQIELADGRGARASSAELVEPGYFRALGLGEPQGWQTSDPEQPTPMELVVSRVWAASVFGEPSLALGELVRVNGEAFRIVEVFDNFFEGTSPQPVQIWMPTSSYVFDGLDIGRFVWNTQAVVSTSRPERLAKELEIFNEKLISDGVLKANQRLEERPLGASSGVARIKKSQSSALAVLAILLLVFVWFFAAWSSAALSLRSSRDDAIRKQLGAAFPHLFREQARHALRFALLATGSGILALLGLRLLLIRIVPAIEEVKLSIVDLSKSGALFFALGLVGVIVIVLFLPLLSEFRRNDQRISKNARKLSAGRAPLRVVLFCQASVAGLFVFLGVNASFSYFEELSFRHGVSVGLSTLVHFSAKSAPGTVTIVSEDMLAGRLDALMIELSRAGQFEVAGSTRFPGASGVSGSEVVSAQSVQFPDRLAAGVPALATPSFFKMAGLQLLSGQSFSDVRSRGEIVVSESFAISIFGSAEKATGELVDLREQGRDRSVRHRVIGVVADMFLDGRAHGPTPMVYFSALTGSAGQWIFLVEPGHGHDSTRLSRWLEESGAPFILDKVLDSKGHASEAAGPQLLPAIFGAAAALILAAFAAGSAGFAVSLAVEARARELAIRSSLGEPPLRLLSRMMLGTTVLAMVGFMFGAGLLAPVVSASWPGLLDSWNLEVFACASVLMLTIVLVALFPAARRVLRLQPAALLGVA